MKVYPLNSQPQLLAGSDKPLGGPWPGSDPWKSTPKFLRIIMLEGPLNQRAFKYLYLRLLLLYLCYFTLTVSLPPRGIPIPPFTFSNSSIVRARALISFIFAIILLFLIVILTVFDDAKLRRFSSDSKKFHGFFSKLYGQSPDLWTNRRNPFKICPKEQINDARDGIYQRGGITEGRHSPVILIS